MPFDILGLGLASPAGDSTEALLSALENPPQPAPLPSPAGLKPLATAAYTCDLPRAMALLDPLKARRWGRLQVLALAAAKRAGLPGILNGQEVETGVYVGTGMGSLGETAIFLENMVRQKENFPKPAHFVNSVHNSAASTLGLEFGLKGENITVTHREISFDAALGHALSALRQGRVRTAVVCGVDEINYYLTLDGETRGLWKKGAGALRPLAQDASQGTLPGEGAAVLVLSRQGEGGVPPLARVLGVRHARYARSARSYLSLPKTGDFLKALLDAAGLGFSDLDLVLTGANGDRRLDSVYRRVGEEWSRRAGRTLSLASYKQLCGEYRAASGLGVALGALCLAQGRVPTGLLGGGGPRGDGSVKTILVYDLSRSGTHAACLLGKP